MIKNDYLIGSILGSGMDAQVRLAQHRTTGHHVAIKIINHHSDSIAAMQSVIDEAAILHSLQPHENILNFIDFYVHPEQYIIVAEAMHLNLLEYLDWRQNKLTEMEIRSIF